MKVNVNHGATEDITLGQNLLFLHAMKFQLMSVFVLVSALWNALEHFILRTKASGRHTEAFSYLQMFNFTAVSVGDNVGVQGDKM